MWKLQEYTCFDIIYTVCLEENKLIRALRDIWYSVTRPDAYRGFMNYKLRRLLLHVLILVGVSGIITIVIPAISFLSSGGFGRIIEEEIPDFRITSGEGFYIEKPIEIDEYNLFIKADSNVVKEDISDLDGEYGAYDYVIVVDREQIYVKTAGVQEITARFDEMEGMDFSKEDLLGYVPVMYLCYIWVFVLALLVDYGYYFLVSFIVSWIAGVIASFMKVRLGSRKLFRMAVYAGTLSYILTLIQTVMGYYVPNFTFFSFLITLGYMFFAIKDYKESGIEELPPEQFGREG